VIISALSNHFRKGFNAPVSTTHRVSLRGSCSPQTDGDGDDDDDDGRSITVKTTEKPMMEENKQPTVMTTATEKTVTITSATASANNSNSVALFD